MNKVLYLFALLFYASTALHAQKQKFDSLSLLLKKEKTDTGKVSLMWQMAEAGTLYNPDSSLQIAQNAFYLAQKIGYEEGESRALSIMAISLRQIGNYQKSLEYFLQKLQLEEKGKSPRNLASALINIGIQYVYLEQYDEALAYYRRADSVIEANIKVPDVAELEYYINNNLGDVFERLNIDDSAFLYFSKSLVIAKNQKNNDFIGSSMIGFGHIYLKQDNTSLALQYYNEGLAYLLASNDDDLVCEATLGLAKLYDKLAIRDSVEKYAMQSFSIAKQDGFESRQMDAASFLTAYYKSTGDIIHAFQYSEITQVLKDSVSSKESIRALQVISSNEKLRQNEIAESKRKADEERHKQLQLLMIGIFIVLLFSVTMMLSRIKINFKLIRFLGVLSLLMFFEYLLLLLHPRVLAFTHHTPVYEIIIFVAIASVLVPAHHRIEHWVIEYLMRKKTKPAPKEPAPQEAEE